MILTNKKIAILSGYGEVGSAELYGGTLSERAIRNRLAHERCHGDRWARAVQYVGENSSGAHGVNLETEEPCGWPDGDDGSPL